MAEQAAKTLSAPRLEARIASKETEQEGAFRLRYEVFVEEERNVMLRNASGLETDEYDAYCDHLIVEDLDTGRVVGTYRLLPGDRAMRHIGFYSETEFDLSAFEERKPRALELGRSCIAPEYRNGRAIQLLWEGIAQYISRRNYEHLIGCASIPFHTMEELLETYTLLHHKSVITDRYGIRPLPSHTIPGLRKIELAGEEKELFRRLPPLMKGYQWLGAEIGGDPAYDPIFGTVDFFIVLDKERMSRRYRKHFLE